MKFEMKSVVVEAVKFQKDMGLEDGFAVYETEYPEEGHTFEVAENIDLTRMTIIQPAVQTPTWKVVSEGEWIVTYSDGQKEIWTDDRFKERFQKVIPEPAFEGTVKEGFGRRFTVINERDYRKHVLPSLKERFEEVLGEVLEHVEIGRELEGKHPYNNYVVINLDEPYINEIIEIMKRNGHWG